MRISRDMVIAGMPAFELRSFFQRAGHSPWNVEMLADTLGLAGTQARQVLEQLVHEGYAEPSEVVGFRGRGYFQATIKGSGLALANASRPLKRVTATRLVDEAIARAHKVNEDPRHLFWITKLSAFGSYLGDAPTLGDVDLVVELTPKNPERDEHFEAARRYGEEAERNGRRFGSFLDLLTWAETELLQVIKSKSGYLSIHTPRDDILALVETQTLYEFRCPTPTGG